MAENKEIKRGKNGQFAKGECANPDTVFKAGPGAKERASRAGIKSGEVRREKKGVADALRKVLAEKIDGDVDKLDAITAKVVKKMFDNPDIRDLKVLAEILGELKQTFSAEGLSLNITASDEGARNINKLING